MKSGCAPSAARASCSGCLTRRCVRGHPACSCMNVCICLFVCAFPRGFLWCYRGNWMCGAHQKSPLALGKRSFNPSMPLWKAQPKVRLILSTGKHQMVPLFSPSQPPSLCSAVASEESPLTCNDMTIHMHGGRRETCSWWCTPCSPQCSQLITVDFSVIIILGGLDCSVVELIQLRGSCSKVSRVLNYPWWLGMNLNSGIMLSFTQSEFLFGNDEQLQQTFIMGKKCLQADTTTLACK